MKILKITLACVLLCAMLIGGETFSALALENGDPTMVFPSETDSFVEDFLIDETNQDAPFFEKILPAIAANIEENNKKPLTPYFDEFPLANNPENFQGLGSTTYANINGKTVTAEAFYRVHNESRHDPNCGMGLLIYQCIQYKLKHPEEDVKIAFASYRTSVTASVCVLPESKYYGYMRSLYGTNYDDQGFVRISFMLVEAARMGIEVTMINQLPSYGVWQYNPAIGDIEKRSHIDYVKYYKAALPTECYDKYAPGKKVSDFLNPLKVEWTVSDQTENMQHTKTAIVSHYLATDGTEHSPGVFFSSSNFDENNYRGANGNNNSQSGVIVSDHDDLFRVTYNYIKLMEKYSYQEGQQELRLLMKEANEKQIALIQSGRGDEIPPDEQIVYLGTENDPIFELYFTPIGGAPDTWDTVHNPIAKHMDKLSRSKDYVEFVWVHMEYARPYTGTVIEKILVNKYCNEPNPNNKIVARVTDFQIDPINDLEMGTEIGYRQIIKEPKGTHSKDLMMSYEEDGTRHYVSIMTSCNYYMIAFNLRTNSILVINETDETGNGFYRAFGSRYSYGMMGEYKDPSIPVDGQPDDPSKNNGGTDTSVENASTDGESTCDHIDEDGDSICDLCGADLTTRKLSSIAIAAIIIGSVAVVGVGGFFGFRFVTKKKRANTSPPPSENSKE